MLSNEELVNHLIKSGILNTKPIVRAFLKVDRKEFVGTKNWKEAYGDYPLSIGRGQTISQPTTVVFMLELLQPRAGDKILDIGSGSGWTTALLAELVGQAGYVYGIEIVPELVEFGRKNLAKLMISNAEINEAQKRLGWPAEALYDKILVSAASRELPPELIEQLKPNGRLVIPIHNSIWKIEKIDDNKIRQESYPGFMFVPLVR